MTAPVLAHHAWPTNAHLIEACATLGHLTVAGLIWDGTYGLGTFWRTWTPPRLLRTDIDPTRSPDAPSGRDATATNYLDATFGHVVLDPPYKLNGTDQGEGARYGVAGGYTSVDQRHDLMHAMLREGTRVLRSGGTLIYKCQDQTTGGRKVWQSDLVTGWAYAAGLDKIDALQIEAYRPQPQRSTCEACGLKIMRRADGRWGDVRRGDWNEDPYGEAHGGHQPDPCDNGQALSHSNYSTLLVFRKAQP